MTIIGSRIERVEDRRFLTHGATYTDDLQVLPDALYVTFVRSTEPHARVLSVDVSEALSLDGVVAVFTGADVDDLKPVPVDMGMLPNWGRAWLARDTVRYVGEPVAVIVSETRAIGEDALERVVVDYDPLPAVVDLESALSNEVVLHPSIGTNVAASFDAEPLDMSDCDVVVRARIINNKMAICPMEMLCGQAHWTEAGRLEMWTTSQGPHVVRGQLCGVYGLDPSMVRVVSPDVGGGFGGKAFPYLEQLFLPWISRRVGRAVRWNETRSESMLTIGHGRGQIQDVVIGGMRDGRVRAYDLTVLQDIGAYPRVSTYLPVLTKMLHAGTYSIERTACRSNAVVTNTVPMMAFRGAGRPEAAAAIERAMDLFAAEIGMDPVEVRRRNLLPPDVFPYTSTGGAVYDSGDYEKALDLLLAAADYDSLRSEQAARRASGDPVQMGIGLSVYVEVTGGAGGAEFARLQVLPTGKARVLAGSFSHGQGHATGWAMIVSSQTGIPIHDIEVIDGDTDVVPQGGLTGGSRSVQIAGSNVLRATELVVDRAREAAAALLEAHVDDVVLDADGGRFHVVGTPSRSLAWPEVAASVDAADGLAAQGDFVSAGGTFPSGAHLVVVDVDTETGKVTVRRVVAADDAGRILNPLLAEGQIHGGLASGIAQALLEEVVYAPDGTPLTTNLADYGMISAAELPSFETIHVETPSPLNPLGAKGIGESGSIGSTPAVQNAVVDALSHLGIRHVDMPLTASRVWAAIEAART